MKAFDGKNGRVVVEYNSLEEAGLPPATKLERINELCKLNHITTNKLSELSTVPATTLYALLYDKVENPSSKNIYKLN